MDFKVACERRGGQWGNKYGCAGNQPDADLRQAHGAGSGQFSGQHVTGFDGGKHHFKDS